MDGVEYERRKMESYSGRYLEFKKAHEEVAELCEYWGDLADRERNGEVNVKVTRRRLRSTELRDLACGYRVLMIKEVGQKSDDKSTDLTALCEYYADQIDRDAMMSSRAAKLSEKSSSQRSTNLIPFRTRKPPNRGA